MGAFIDLTGKKYGRLTVIERTQNKGKETMWICLCDCGNKIVVQGNNLKSGHSKSCGCYNSEATANRNYKHGKRHTRLYTIWSGMRRRCYEVTNPKYKDYGGRGIVVCEEWKDDFNNFYLWSMSHGYKDNLTIDRIDVNGNYEPSNCRWATNKEQANNRRSNKLYSYKGKTQNISQWANEFKIPYHKLHERLKKGWNIDKALNTP